MAQITIQGLPKTTSMGVSDLLMVDQIDSTKAITFSDLKKNMGPYSADMISGLSTVAKSGNYGDLQNRPTKLSQFANDIGVGGSGETAIKNTLDNYPGATLNEKMVALFDDINKNHKSTPMEIILPDGIIEITQDLEAKHWNNKVLRCNGNIVFKNCNAFHFNMCRHNDIFIHRVSSIAVSDSNPCGLQSPNEVNSLTKRGIKVTDSNCNIFTFNTIVGFTTGLHVYSELFSLYSSNQVLPGLDPSYDCGGTYYNDFYINAIWRCKQAILLSAGRDSRHTSAGWVNDNRFFNTFIDCNRGVQIGLPYGDRPTGEPVDSYHNNRFYAFGFEQIRGNANPISPVATDPTRVAIDMMQGVSNIVSEPRFEGSMGDTGYMIIKEGKDCRLNKYTTSNYYVNLNRVILNTSSKKDDGSIQSIHGSTLEGALWRGMHVGEKMIACNGTTVQVGYGMTNYNLNSNGENFTLNFFPQETDGSISTTSYARVKVGGAIKDIKYV